MAGRAKYAHVVPPVTVLRQLDKESRLLLLAGIVRALSEGRSARHTGRISLILLQDKYGAPHRGSLRFLEDRMRYYENRSYGKD